MEQANGQGRMVFSGKVLQVRVDPVVAKGGLTSREVVQRPSAVAVVAQTESGEIVIVRQFRWAIGAVLDELPAGLVETQEDPGAAARRELKEETGYSAEDMSLMTEYYASPGYSTERIGLYFAQGLELGETDRDPDEEIDVTLWNRARVLRYLSSPEIKNASLVIGLQWWMTRHP